MLPEHIQSASSTDGPLKPHETAANGGDNIITITTASINERNTPTDFDIEQIKSNQHSANNHTNQTTSFVSKQQQRPPADTHSASNASTEVAPAARPHFKFCKASQWISFQDNVANVHHRRGRRLNGLQLPLHPLQVFGWLVLILFGLASFWVLIPSFSVEIQGPLYGLISGLYIVHVVSHLTALLLDPADRELRRVHRNDRIVPEFDRSKHTHVIENGRCHLCNIRTSSQRTKHCSVCNKCVGKFDHHCKWLNHCIGSRNYVAFLMCVVSAVIATLVIVAAVIAHIVLYYVQPEWLTFWYAKGGATASSNGDGLDGSAEILAFAVNSSLNETSASNSSVFFDLTGNGTDNVSEFLLEDTIYLENSTLPTIITDNLTSLLAESVNGNALRNLSTAATSIFLEEPGITESAIIISTNNVTASTVVGIGISDTIFLILIGFLGLLAAITAGLLLHLCFFHIYISFLGLTTYEYIRNHRQSQEAKAKNLLSALPKNGPSTHSNTHPSRKTNDCGQIYFCSSLRNPNATSPTDLQYFENHKSENEHRSAMHCCTNSREYHQTAAKTYYMCSLLAEGSASPPMNIAHISGGGSGEDSYESEPMESDELKTFHCCSTFAATITQRKVSAATKKATLVSDLEATTAASLSARRSYMQFTEQCTFCTFRIRSPIVTKRSSSATSTTHSLARQPHSALNTEVSQNSKDSLGGSSAEQQRCCVKAISKHQRWRRKWNCCSSVPDSPDVPNDIIAALAARHPYATAPSAGKKINATEIPVHFIQAANGNRSNGIHTRPISPNNANFKVQNARVNNTRTWPVARLRHMLRMLSRYRRPRCRHHNVDTPADQIKQNQIRPLQLQNNANGCQHHHHHHYYDSSSPQPPSSTTTASERSSDQSNYSDSSAITTPSSTVETILPTSVIRDDTSMTYTTTPMCIALPPALPPPTRRKIPSPTDLEELADTLGFSSHSHPSSGLVSHSPAQRLPALNNIYRRQRRKHFLRTRSPTLSPIHESGLSNPTSPQLPCRHNATSCSPTPTVAAAASIVVNNLCGSVEPVRKTASNSSLHSISSNSSST